MEHIPHVVLGVPFAAFCKFFFLYGIKILNSDFEYLLVIVIIASKELYKANAYQFNVYKRRLMGL